MDNNLAIDLATAIAQLESGDYSNRRSAARFLEDHVDEIIDQLLVLAVQDRHPQSMEALKLLRYSDDVRRIEVFEIAIGSSNPTSAQSALSGLQSLIPLPIDKLLDSLPRLHPFIMPHVMRILGQVDDPKLADVLIQYLEQSEDVISKYTIIAILAEKGDVRFIPIIERYLDHDNHHVRNYSMRALEQLRKSSSVE